jgi:hypothetical protein
VVETLAARFDSDVQVADDDPEAQQRLDILAGYRSNAMGLQRYWRKRFESEAAAS